MESRNARTLTTATYVLACSFLILPLTGCMNFSNATSAPSAQQTLSTESVYATAENTLHTEAATVSKQLPALPSDAPEAVLKAETELREYIVSLEASTPLKDWADETGEASPTTIADIQSVVDSTVEDLHSQHQMFLQSVKQMQESRVPENESPEARMSRIQEDTGLVLEYDIGDCAIVDGTEIAGGCYNWGDTHIRFTPTWFQNASECEIRKTLAHEYRHYEQNENGDNDNMSSDELEEDARNNEYRGGCL